ncbi:MAG: dihydroorotate dehydrogenase-like protein [Salinivirgaceae bacterium]|jgi:dihydroorotate dehydrogenase (fumarate)|nr:dihydroorotate dehydrogenase-like protein [Salinivirgaceae bacterium]
MADLKTNFAGLELKNPLIVGSSGLTDSVDKIKDIAAKGAGAVILKSLFEEQISFEVNNTISSNQANEYPEAADYIKEYTKNNNLSQYLNLIKDAKKAVDIPIIASINCITADEWIDFATKIEQAGADAIEVNVFILPTDKNKDSATVESIYHELFTKLKKQIKLPIIFKIGQNFTNITALLNRFNAVGVDAVTLFNRYYEPDIDIDNLSIKSAEVFSNPSDLRKVLRWVAISSGKIQGLDISASTGVHSGEAMIKLLLAGASSVQVCSALYKNGTEKITEILSELENWMDKQSFKSIKDFQGKLNYEKINNPEMYERSQFMKYFSSHT